MKILLVDLDAELRALIAFALAQSGFESCLAVDEHSVLKLLELESPDRILLDHGGLLDGIVLCRSCAVARGCRS